MQDLTHNQIYSRKGGEDIFTPLVYVFEIFEVWCWTPKNLLLSFVKENNYGPHNL